MAAAATSRDSGIDIRRLTLGLRLRGDPQRLEPVARRLEDVARGRLPQALARVQLDPAPAAPSEAGEELIFIERLAVECSANTAWDDDALVSHMARRLALALQSQLAHPGVLRFRDRADYVAAAALAIADGRLAQCWWFDEFEGLAPLAASTALRTLVINEAANGAAALARLAPLALEQLLRALGEGDAARLSAGLAGFDAGGVPAFEVLWPAAVQLQRDGDAPVRWLGALVAGERAVPGSMGARSLRLLRDMVALLRRAAAGDGTPWRRALDRPSLEALLAADGRDSGWLHDLSASRIEAVLATLRDVAAPHEPAAAQSLLTTRHGGFFLLLARVHRLGWLAHFESVLQQRRPEWPASRRDALCRALACRVAAVALAALAWPGVLGDPAIVAACGLEGMELEDHPDLVVAGLRTALRAGSTSEGRSHATVLQDSAHAARWPRLVTHAAAVLLARLARAVPGLAASTPAFLRAQALALPAVLELAPDAMGPTVVRLGRAPLDVLLVLCGVKRHELALPGVAAIQLREDYSA